VFVTNSKIHRQGSLQDYFSKNTAKYNHEERKKLMEKWGKDVKIKNLKERKQNREFICQNIKDPDLRNVLMGELERNKVSKRKTSQPIPVEIEK
jgi:hypothetical protein